MCKNLAQLESLRQRYRPNKVKILFICESPPRDSFFYCKNSVLFHATYIAFRKVYGDVISVDF